MSVFSLMDAVKYREECLEANYNAQVTAMNAEIPSFEKVKTFFMESIKSYPNKNKHQMQLYLLYIAERMPETLRAKFEQHMKEKYLPAFPGFEVVCIQDSRGTYFLLELKLAE